VFGGHPAANNLSRGHSHILREPELQAIDVAQLENPWRASANQAGTLLVAFLNRLRMGFGLVGVGLDVSGSQVLAPLRLTSWSPSATAVEDAAPLANPVDGSATFDWISGPTADARVCNLEVPSAPYVGKIHVWLVAEPAHADSERCLAILEMVADMAAHVLGHSVLLDIHEAIERSASEEQRRPSNVTEALELMCSLTHCAAAIVWSYDQTTARFHAVARFGLPRAIPLTVPQGRGYVGGFLDPKQPKPAVISSLDPDLSYHPRLVKEQEWKSLLIYPIAVGEAFAGALTLYKATSGSFSLMDVLIADVAAQRSSHFISAMLVADRMSEVEGKLQKTLDWISAGLVAMELVHDLGDVLLDVRAYTASLKGFVNRRLTPGEQQTVEQLDRSLAFLNHAFRRMKSVRRGRSTKPTTFDLWNAIDNVLALCAVQADHRRITLTTRGGRQAILVTADRDDIERVMHNLVSNALYFSEALPGDRRRVEIHAYTQGDWVYAAIHDHGPGIPRENMARIFEPFFTTRSDRGMGLGLNIALRLVEQWGGRLSVDSAPGRGSVFTLQLPSVG
jgi:signal transduction histidine kinase